MIPEQPKPEPAAKKEDAPQVAEAVQDEHLMKFEEADKILGQPAGTLKALAEQSPRQCAALVIRLREPLLLAHQHKVLNLMSIESGDAKLDTYAALRVFAKAYDGRDGMPEEIRNAVRAAQSIHEMHFYLREFANVSQTTDIILRLLPNFILSEAQQKDDNAALTKLETDVLTLRADIAKLTEEIDKQKKPKTSADAKAEERARMEAFGDG